MHAMHTATTPRLRLQWTNSEDVDRQVSAALQAAIPAKAEAEGRRLVSTAILLKGTLPGIAGVARAGLSAWPAASAASRLRLGLPCLLSVKFVVISLHPSLHPGGKPQVREALSSGNGLYSVDQEQLQQLAPDVMVTQARRGTLQYPCCSTCAALRAARRCSSASVDALDRHGQLLLSSQHQIAGK